MVDGVPMTIAEAAHALRSGTISSVELTAALLSRADKSDDLVGGYISRFDDTALAAAQQADADLAAGDDHGPLHGIPLGIKDIIAAREGRTTAQSQVHDRGWWAGEDAVAVERLRSAGAVISGKLTTMEFGIGFPDSDQSFPTPRNPWDLARWAGGSSSGCANSVAAGFVLGGLGSDGGGSIRVPAAWCGITGHKPTFGLVPKSGCVPVGYSSDHIGPMARSARDCALLLDALAGFDPSDPYSAPAAPPRSTAALVGHSRGVRIGVFRCFEAPGQTSDPDLAAVFDAAVDIIVSTGASRRDVKVPRFAQLADAACIGFLADGLAYHRRNLQTRWSDYGRPTRLALATGALYSGADYVQAARVRRQGLTQIAEVFRDVDVIVLPTTLAGAIRLDTEGVGERAFTGRPTQPTPAFNALGLPAVSVPMGFTRSGLPLGLQIVGRPFEDATVLRVGDAYQQSSDWHLQVPPLTSSPPQRPSGPATSSPPTDERALGTVATLLKASGITPSDAELEILATGYPTLCEITQALDHALESGDVGPVLAFKHVLP